METARRRGDLRLSVVARGFPDYTSRQIQRWAVTGKIPGCYPLKRGHWRVRDCPAFRRWWKINSPAPLHLAVTGFKFPGQNVKGLFATIEKHRPQIDRLTKVIALKTRSGMSGWKTTSPDLSDPDQKLWWGRLDDLPENLLRMARDGDVNLDVAVAVGELQARGITSTAAAVAKFMGVSRATFYRRGHGKRLRRCVAALADEPERLQLPAKRRNTINYDKRKGEPY